MINALCAIHKGDGISTLTAEMLMCELSKHGDIISPVKPYVNDYFKSNSIGSTRRVLVDLIPEQTRYSGKYFTNKDYPGILIEVITKYMYNKEPIEMVRGYSMTDLIEVYT